MLLAFLALLPTTVQAQGSNLENWLRWRSPDLRRDDDDLRTWRRAEGNLSLSLLRVATDASKPTQVRTGAIYVLGVVGDTQGVEQGLGRLGQDKAVASVAAAARGRVQARVRVLALMRGLVPHAHAAPDEAGAAALERAARSLDPQASRELEALTGDRLFDAQTPGRPLRCVAARLLGWTAGRGASKTLAKTARDGFAGMTTRRACVYALGAAGSDRLLAGVLIELGNRPEDWDLGDSPEEWGLLRVGLGLLDASSTGFRHACKRLLADGATSPRLQVALAEDLADRRATSALDALESLAQTRRGFDRHEHLALARALGRLDRARVDVHAPQLVDYALATDDELAGEAVAALLELRLTRTDALLSDVLGRPDPGGRTRVRALQVIELLSLQRLTSRVAELLGEPSVPWSARQAAAHALGSLGSTEGALALAGALQANPGGGEPAALRREVADALGASPTRTDSGRTALEGALLDPEPTVRRAVLRALAAYGDPRSHDSVRKLLKQPSPSARECQARLRTCTQLRMFDGPSARLLLGLWRTRERDLETALAVVTYGRDLRPALVVETLLDLLGHEHAAVGKAAVAELLRRHTPNTEGGTFGYNASAGATARRAAIAKWRKAWAEDPKSFR